MTLLKRIDLGDVDATGRRILTRRTAVPDPSVRRRAEEICEEVRTGGHAALVAFGDLLGGGCRRISEAELDEATARISPPVRTAIESAIAAVERVHSPQQPVSQTIVSNPGVEITRAWTPLQRVGAYVPGGKATYPSTVVMTVVPARLAGVSEVVVVSPAGPDGSMPDATLAACRLAGADEVWAMGGAQAVAALAYGTEEIRPVQKIVGPGNTWVTAAKLAVHGACAIDLPAGPSEVLVLADAGADPRLVAVDLLCQAEHGPDSPAVLVTTDETLVGAVETELTGLLPTLERADILAKALADHGAAVVAPTHAEAVAFANEYAAEHVSIMTADPEADADAITAAGSVYVGRWAPESAGDYATGANHVLPTGGLAAAYGPLSTESFGSWRQVQRMTRDGLAQISPTISELAAAEGLTAHRLAAQIRLDLPEETP